MTREEAWSEIAGLKHGEKWIWPESDYGKAEIWRLHDTYVLFAIPNFGGEPKACKADSLRGIDNLVDMVLSWT